MLFIAMRASSNKSAHRHLAARKRSIVFIVAGLAMVLGTMSVGPSLLSNDDTVLQRERAATRSLEESTSSDEQLTSDTANPMNDDQNILGDTTSATNTPVRKPAEGAGSAAASAAVQQINPVTPNPTPSTTPTDPPATPATDPTDPAGTDPGTGTQPDPDDDGEVLGDSTTNPSTNGSTEPTQTAGP
jgi:hypothetical protein